MSVCSTRTLGVLEFDKILMMLADCAQTAGAKERALALLPAEELYTAERLQAETAEARTMLDRYGAPPLGSVKDITNAADRAAKGAMLSLRELLDVAALLYSTARVSAYSRPFVEAEALYGYFCALTANDGVEKRINRAIISEDSVADEASPALGDIRRNIRRINSKIKDLLAHYTANEAYAKALQDNIVTIRNGRYVIPVKAEYKSAVKGLVHDTSSSGATLFIEPMAVVDANNELKELELAESKEIERILYSLSAEVGEICPILISNYENLTALALVFAKASLAVKMKAYRPELSEGGEIRLPGARHPLLNAEKTVPVDIMLGGDFDTLIITGPNTGGKTVSLKTLGLFVLMAQAGMQLSAKEGARVRVCERVFADIGDEQSIEQSLSTFSAHMKNIVGILAEANSRSLVLFDELGAGTDPIEGAALGVSIIERVREIGALQAATTHYAELKMFALENEGVCNAACEFSLETLAPTYRLIIGAPGKSNAFAISRRLGLGADIIARAKSHIDKDSKKFEHVISKLELARAENEKAANEAKSDREEYKKLLGEAKAERERAAAEAKKLLECASEQANRITESARATSDFVLSELERAKRAWDSERAASELESARESIRKSLRAGKDRSSYNEERPKDYAFSKPLEIGDEVVVVGVGSRGVLASLPDKDGNVTVKIGALNMKTAKEKIMLAKDSIGSQSPEEKKKRRVGEAKVMQSARSFSPEIDLRGMTGDEAWIEVDRYIDNAILCGVSSVRLIHGKGTGALKRYLWDILKRDKRVKSHRIGAYGEGDGGVTVCELK